MKNVLLLSLGILAMVTACDLKFQSDKENAAEKRVLQKNIHMGQVKAIDTYINMKAGKLTVSGGAQDLMEADIHFSREKWKPDIRFSEDGEKGQLTIEQPEMTADLSLDLDDDQNEWTIRLNNQIVQDLYCEIGAGETDLNLQGLILTRVRIDAGVGAHKVNLHDCSIPALEVNAGVGEVTLDLTGRWRNDLEAEIVGGIGALHLRLPRDVGIRLEVKGGLGNVEAPDLKQEGRVYTNALFEQTDYHLNFDIKAGMGSVEIALE